MGAFNTKKLIYAPSSMIPEMGKRLVEQFEVEGYQVMATPLCNGGYDVSITKGNVFKAIAGMKSALKVTLTPHNDKVIFEASVGIFGQQVIPTIVSMLFFWPVLITQIWGIVQQSKLDDKALAIVEEAARNCAVATSVSGKFCSECGRKIDSAAKFCPECGAKL